MKNKSDPFACKMGHRFLRWDSWQNERIFKKRDEICKGLYFLQKNRLNPSIKTLGNIKSS